MSFSSELKDAHSSTKKNSEELKKLKRLVEEAKAARERGEPLTPEQEDALNRANNLASEALEQCGIFLAKSVVSVVVEIGGAVYGLATWDSKNTKKVHGWVRKTFWSKK